MIEDSRDVVSDVVLVEGLPVNVAVVYLLRCLQAYDQLDVLLLQVQKIKLLRWVRAEEESALSFTLLLVVELHL